MGDVQKCNIFDGLQKNMIPLAIGFIHWLATFYLETLFLEVSPAENWFNYILCKTVVLVALLLFWWFVWTAITKKGSHQREIAVYTIPYLVVLVVYLFRHHDFVLVSDELNIYLFAKQLKDYAQWFVCYTGYYWISSLMMIPTMMGPTIIKIVLQSMVCGYCVFRMHRLVKQPWAYLLYGLFLLPELLINGISAHRMPTYGVLYLLFLTQLVFDFAEKAPLTRKKLVLLSIAAAVLAHWRSEGIYLVLLGLVLIVLAYGVHSKKDIVKTLAVFYCLHALVVAPQFIGSFGTDTRYLNLRMQHFYSYCMVNMSRNGLDLSEHPRETEQMSAVTPKEGIDYLNQHIGNGNYSGAYLLTAMNPYLADSYSKEDINDFCNAARAVILRHPFVFLKSQFNAWRYTSSQFTIDLTHGFRVAVQSLYYILRRPVYPFLLLIVFWLMSIFRKKLFAFFVTSGALANWAIVVLLLPAAYAKYFYVVYLTGYFLLFFLLIRWLGRKGVKFRRETN